MRALKTLPWLLLSVLPVLAQSTGHEALIPSSIRRDIRRTWIYRNRTFARNLTNSKRRGNNGQHRLQTAKVIFLVRHRINDIVDANANSERGEFLVVSRVVGPFPGIAEVRLESHRHH
jgi:hypothetical protein